MVAHKAAELSTEHKHHTIYTFEHAVLMSTGIDAEGGIVFWHSFCVLSLVFIVPAAFCLSYSVVLFFF